MRKFIGQILARFTASLVKPLPPGDALLESSDSVKEFNNNHKTREKPMGDTLNGLNLEGLGALVEGLKANPHMAKSIWYASSEWKGGFACDVSSRNFNWKIDEPTDLCGTDIAANPVEMYLGALCACLTIGYNLNATMMGVEISKLQVDAEGDIDLPGFVGLADAPGFEDQAKTPGYQNIRVKVRLKSNATPEQLQQIHKNVMATSPVGLSVSNSVGLNVEIETRRFA